MLAQGGVVSPQRETCLHQLIGDFMASAAAVRPGKEHVGALRAVRLQERAAPEGKQNQAEEDYA
jgi:hypothetical protein